MLATVVALRVADRLRLLTIRAAGSALQHPHPGATTRPVSMHSANVVVAQTRLPAWPRPPRLSIGFLQIHGLYRLRVWLPFERPRLDGRGQAFALQVGPPKRGLGSLVGHENPVVGNPTPMSISHGHLT